MNALYDEKFVYSATAESREWVATYELDPSTDPKAITFRYKGATQHGIYKVEKDRLTICLSRPGSKRPTEFVTKEGIEVVLVVYNREKNP